MNTALTLFGLLPVLMAASVAVVHYPRTVFFVLVCVWIVPHWVV